MCAQIKQEEQQQASQKPKIPQNKVPKNFDSLKSCHKNLLKSLQEKYNKANKKIIVT